MEIGIKIKDLRIRQKATLKELAKKTGLTASFLSQLERDIASPSVSSLEKLAQALNTSVGHFFEDKEQKELVFIKKGVGKKFIGKEKRIACERLAAGLLGFKMCPIIYTLGINGELPKEMYGGGEKFGMVLKGKIEFIYDKGKMIFEKGDSIFCRYTQRLSRIRNIGKTEVEILWIIFMPS